MILFMLHLAVRVVLLDTNSVAVMRLSVQIRWTCCFLAVFGFLVDTLFSYQIFISLAWGRICAGAKGSLRPRITLSTFVFFLTSSINQLKLLLYKRAITEAQL